MEKDEDFYINCDLMLLVSHENEVRLMMLRHCPWLDMDNNDED